MSVYERILEIARAQAAAASNGDLATAAGLLTERGELIAAAPKASQAYEPIIRAILELDRDVATAFRRRMIAIRDESLAMRQGQQALAGYGGTGGRHRDPRLVDRTV